MNHTVSASPSPINAILVNPAGGTISRSTTATPSGGVGPFTYSWAWASGGSDMTISNASTATCTVSSTAYTTIWRSGVLRCTVTDTGNSNYQASVDVAVDFNWETGM